MDNVKKLADLILSYENISFTLLEIGAVPLNGEPERFHQLLDLFPNSQILAFEVDEASCEEFNKTAKKGMRFFANALGDKEETRVFYETQHSMCCSLYPPNEKLLSLFNALDVMYLKSVGSINTISLDYFVQHYGINSVDFIKIDIQGAELDVFRGGLSVLKQVVGIICEVEFIPMYENQPLFGDVCAFLTEQDFMFHRFLGIAGRSLSPVVIEGNVNNPTQDMWSDAFFIRHLLKLSELSPEKLLKLAMLAYLYASPDLTYHCFQCYDELKKTDLRGAFCRL